MTEQVDSELANFARIADLSFRNRTAMLYEGVIRDCTGLVDQYSKEGIASTRKYLRKAVDAVTAQFQTVEKLFEEIYIGPFENKPLPRTTEQWLREAVQNKIESESARAERVARQICSPFMNAAPNLYTAYTTHLSDEGRDMQRRLNDAITVLALKSNARAGKAPTPTPSSSDKDTLQKPESSLLVFISHSSKDAELAQALIELLRAGLGLRADQIRCSSVDGYRLPVGADTEAKLREEINAAKAVIGLITPSSLASAYVMFELGARWGAGRFLAPLLAGVQPRDLARPLSLLNALSCKDAQLHQLLGDVAAQLGLPVQAPQSYVRYISIVIRLAEAISTAAAQPSAPGFGQGVRVSISAEGTPPSQVLKVIASEPVAVSRLEYMLSDGTCIVGEDMAAEGQALEVPLRQESLTKLLSIPRPNMHPYDLSGPVKLGLTVSTGGRSQQYVFPARLENVAIGNTYYRKIIGSKSF